MPKKEELLRHVTRWERARNESYRVCRGKKDSMCRTKFIEENHPNYADINGWDIGAAQFRWPSRSLSNRKLIMPDGKVYEGITLSELFDYKVSIQLLTEDLTKHWQICSKLHTHYYHRDGRRIRRIKPEDAYYVHHHAGIHGFSERNWHNVRRHLKVLRRHVLQPVANLMSKSGIFPDLFSFSAIGKNNNAEM